MKKKSIFSRKFKELTGCIHNHSEYSFDSNVPLKKIIDQAKQCQLDYITINDHMTFAAQYDPALQKEEKLTCIIGAEINDPAKNNHLLVFESDDIIAGKSAEIYTKKYVEMGATTFVAHPFEQRRSAQFRTYTWTNEENHYFHGLEIWNAVSEWLGHLNPKLNGFFLVFFPHLFIKKPYAKTLQYWDSLNQQNLRKSGIGSTDAHSLHHRWCGINLTFLTHKHLFKTIRTNVLIEEENEINPHSILQALKKGNSYIVNYRLGNPYHFYAGICNERGEGVIFGEEIELGEHLNLYFRLPKMASVKLICNGKKIAQKYDEKGAFPIHQEGAYRLEISRFGRAWIYSNHIFVKER